METWTVASIVIILTTLLNTLEVTLVQEVDVGFQHYQQRSDSQMSGLVVSTVNVSMETQSK